MLTDSELVTRTLGGDGAAFDALMTRHRATVYRQALRRLRHVQDAEEVTQNAFLKAYQNLGRLRDADRFDAWLRAITANECISWVRGREPDRVDSDAGLEAAADPAPGPEQRVLEIELRARIRRALDSLPEHERRVARAFYLEGCSYREIQERYGLTRATLGGYLYRARQRLVRRLEGLFGITWIGGYESAAQTAASPHVAKATVTVATAAAVAVMAGVAPSFHRAPAGPLHPVTVRELRREPPPRRGTFARLLDDVSVSAVPSLGMRSAIAAEPPRASSPAGSRRDEVTLSTDGRTRRFYTQDGRVYVDDAGVVRPATDEETKRYRETLARVRAAKAAAEDARRAADELRAHLKGIDGDAIRRAVEQASRMREKGEELARMGEEIARQFELSDRGPSLDPRDLRMRIDRIQRQATAMAKEGGQFRVDGEKIRRQVEESALQIRRQAEDSARVIQRQAGESARKIQEQAESLRKLAPAMKRDGLSRRERRRIERLGREMERRARRFDAEIRPMLDRIAPMVDEAAKMQRAVPDAREIERSVREATQGLGPMIEQFANDAAREIDNETKEGAGDKDGRGGAADDGDGIDDSPDAK